MGFLSDVFSLEDGRFPVKSRSRLGTWLMIQGALYMMHGLSTEFYPPLWTLVKLVPQESATEGWFRGFGFTVFYIGLFYMFAGLADNKQFAAVSVFMRLVFVPTLFACFLAWSGSIPVPIAIYYALADSTFALITYKVYQMSVADDGHVTSFFSDVFSLQGGRFPVANRSFLGTWSMIQGVLYIVHGLSTESYPPLWTLVKLVPQESAMEGWFRGFGFTVFYIGLFYIFAGLADNKQFAAVSVFMRLVFVPTLFACFLAWSGSIPLLIAIYYALADSTFAFITFFVYQRSVAARSADGLKPVQGYAAC